MWCPVVQVAFVPDGLEAIIFTADGDMRQALNNLQARCGAPNFHAFVAQDAGFLPACQTATDTSAGTLAQTLLSA